MIKLYVSSATCEFWTPHQLALLFKEIKVECQIYQNYSSIISCVDSVEPGFLFCFISLDNIKFKEHVWPLLVKKLNIKCAHVDAEDYKGCVLNWPKVFRQSACTLVNADESNDNLSAFIEDVIDA